MRSLLWEWPMVHACMRVCRYYTSQWRRDSRELPGGFMVDSGVHHMAAMRQVMAPAQPVKVRAMCTTTEADPSIPGTVVGSIEWDSGAITSVSMCMSSTLVRASTWQQAGRECSLETGGQRVLTPTHAGINVQGTLPPASTALPESFLVARNALISITVSKVWNRRKHVSY
jgi:predicted dehydrogenase